MWTEATHETKAITDYRYHQISVDLTAAAIQHAALACQDMEDFLGGIGRSFKLLETYDVTDAFAPSSPLVMNLGVFSGTEVMTGLRIFFSAYSPLKTAKNGQPLAMWSTASGKFATKLAAAGIDDVVFTGRAAQPVYLWVHKDGDELSLTLEDATALLGLSTHDKIMALADQYDDAHVAAIGPAGEHWQQNAYYYFVRYAVSTFP
jgi:aldehyde:ferredoxin oxidoreductase